MALQKSTQKKLSKATVETLAGIVYHQPVADQRLKKSEVSFASNTLEILLELDWADQLVEKMFLANLFNTLQLKIFKSLQYSKIV